jgi:hypothetical protein
MSTLHPLTPPPGFEQLSKEQQIDYVQQLWDIILEVSEDVPTPDWHLEIVRDRLASKDSSSTCSWSEVKQRLQDKYS